MRYFFLGRDAAESAELLESTVGTVNLHLRHCQTKAGVNSRTALFAWLVQNPGALQRRGKWIKGLHRPNPDCRCAHCTIYLLLEVPITSAIQ